MNSILYKVSVIGIAGALGTLSRYGLLVVVNKIFNGHLPWGTFVVNIIGCFIVGLLWVFSEKYVHLTNEMLAIILIGYVGAFTTFSTLILETFTLFKTSQWGLALINILIHNIVGIAALFMGFTLARLVCR